MNIRKPVDYGTMYRELTAILTQNLPQMDEVYAIARQSASVLRRALQSLLQNFCGRISLTAQAFPHAMCAGCEIFTGLMKMTKRSSVWR